MVYILILLQAHAWCLSVGYVLDSIQCLSGVSENLMAVLVDLANLYILDGIETQPGDFLEVRKLCGSSYFSYGLVVAS